MSAYQSSPMVMGTQGTPQESYEDTQIDSFTLTDQVNIMTRLTEHDSEDDDNEPRPWARLVSLSSAVPHIDLLLDPEEVRVAEGSERVGLYTLGRGKKCKVVFKQKLISNDHCSLYCMKDAITRKLCPYIEDSSANGTYINKSTRLMKSVRRVLHDGDLVSLVNPDVNRPGAATPGDVEAASFFVHIFLPTDKPTKSFNAITSVLRAGGDGKGLPHMRSATVTHLLGQERNIFDYYDQKELLGSGANGQVYRCIHKVDGHECAVKATNMRNSNAIAGGLIDHPSLERVLMEAHMIRTLKHPNIIQLEDVFSDQSTLFLVMELVRGGDLFDRIVARKRYNEGDAKLVVLQILYAMQFMHDKNVAHRDMKPENILLTSPDSDVDIKITDFGLAKCSSDGGGLKTFCGTPHYLAPEIQNQQILGCEGHTTYGFEADMWSIGVITYVLLSGDYPWSQDHGIMCQEIVAGKPNFQKHRKIWKSLSPSALDFVSKLIVQDPKARLSATAAIQHAWLDTVRQPASMESANVKHVDCDSSSMPPPTTTAGQRKGKKRALDVVDMSAETNVADRSIRSRLSTGGHEPMEVSSTMTSRARLPRKAKRVSMENLK